VDASAAQDAGRSDANLEIRQATVRDCPWALGRDCLSAMAELERRVVLARPVLPAYQDVRARRPRVAWRKAASQPVRWVAQVQTVVSLHGLLEIQHAQADESELQQAQSSLARPVLPQSSPPPVLVQEPARWMPQEQPMRALPA
jgi:hypothetical protein